MLVQLRAVGERAVLVGNDGAADREVDPRQLKLGDELTEALHEWARVAGAVRRSEAGGPAAAAAVVARRGLQLAGRVAASMGVPIGYVDPVSGRVRTVEPPGPAQPVRTAGAASAARTAEPVEPVPWLTGLTLSGASMVVVLVAMVTLAVTLAETHVLLAIGSNVVVTGGLLPSVWLIHRTPIWRWVAYGVAAAIVLGWLALPFVLL